VAFKMAMIKKMCYVLRKDVLLYIDIESGEKTELSHMPVSLNQDTYYFISKSVIKTTTENTITTLFEHPHILVEDFESNDLLNPEQWILAAECLKCYGAIPAEQTIESIKFTEIFQLPHAEEHARVLKSLKGNKIRAPAANFPSLTYLTEKHVVCETTDLYRTFATIVSGGRYVKETPNLLKSWILSKRGNRKIPFPPYFVTVLVELGLPESGVFSIVDEHTLVLTRDGLDWINKRAQNAFDVTISCAGVNTAVLRLGRWNVLPAVIITEEESDPKRVTFDAPTKFIYDYIWKAVRGGNWVKAEETHKLSTQKEIENTVFYNRLFKCMWENRRFIYNDTDIDSCTGQVIDSRPDYLKLYDYVAKDSGCITLFATNADTGERGYVDVPWDTCCVYMPSRQALENAALYQLDQFLQHQCKRRHE